jgi:ATP-dependent RNA helicase DHX37/DHR1
MPIEGIILQMKSLNIDTVINFPFPTPPDRQALEKAEITLTHLGALTIGGQITNLGRAMSLFPLSPRFSKMIVTGQQPGCLPYVIAIVSALSIGNPFLHEEALQDHEHISNDDDDDDDDDGSPHGHIRNVKDASRLRRKAFFQSQHVSSTSNSDQRS